MSLNYGKIDEMLLAADEKRLQVKIDSLGLSEQELKVNLLQILGAYPQDLDRIILHCPASVQNAYYDNARNELMAAVSEINPSQLAQATHKYIMTIVHLDVSASTQEQAMALFDLYKTIAFTLSSLFGVFDALDIIEDVKDISL